jgi:hypothetical protein
LIGRTNEILNSNVVWLMPLSSVDRIASPVQLSSSVAAHAMYRARRGCLPIGQTMSCAIRARRPFFRTQGRTATHTCSSPSFRSRCPQGQGDSSMHDDFRLAARIYALVKTIGERIGKPPIGYSETGNVYIHPALARELNKPENEELAELLMIGLRALAAAEPPIKELH